VRFLFREADKSVSMQVQRVVQVEAGEDREDIGLQDGNQEF